MEEMRCCVDGCIQPSSEAVHACKNAECNAYIHLSCSLLMKQSVNKQLVNEVYCSVNCLEAGEKV